MKHLCYSISGLVIEYIVAMDVTRVRFPDALLQLVAGGLWGQSWWHNRRVARDVERHGRAL